MRFKLLCSGLVAVSWRSQSPQLRWGVSSPPVNRAPLGRALIILALGGLCALIVAIRLPFCPMAAVLGVPCPGCGLSRATLALLQGDVRQALHFHPLVFLI